MNHQINPRYNKFSRRLREIFGCRVQKLPLDAGFSCPNRDGSVSYGGCIYCSSKGAASPMLDNTDNLRAQYEKSRRILKRKYGNCKFMLYFQAYTNTYAPAAKLRKLYDSALVWDKQDIVGLSVATRCDCAADDVLDLLADYAQKYYFWLELGLQSARDHTLKLINRGHTLAQYKDAVTRAKSRNLKICVHIIIGLPGEGREDIIAMADLLNSQSIDAVKIHGLYIIRDTPLAKMYYRNDYIPLTFNQYVDLTCDFLERLSPDIIIQRLSSDPGTDELLAPLWMSNKFEVLSAIESRLEARNTRQGISILSTS